MRPPSSSEQPAEAKMSATKASSAFALMVTVISRSSSWSSGPRASRAPHDHERAGRARSGRLLLAGLGLRLLLVGRALQGADVAAVPGRVDHDLVDDDVRRQAGDVADQVADILRLRHAGALLLG